jgi:MoaA/NifB/PqqE/SkfB family radical SAM enzyme
MQFNAVERFVDQLPDEEKVQGKRCPHVLMLEPLHLCNLACMGCGRIRNTKIRCRI